MKTLKLLLISLVFVSSAYAQKVGTYIRAGIGTGASQSFFQSGSLSVEYGKSIVGLEVGIQLSLFNSLPMSTERKSVLTQYEGNELQFVTMEGRRPLSGEREISLMLSAGYNLLSLLRNQHRHSFTPYVGFGWGDLTTVDYNDGVDGAGNTVLSLIYDHTFTTNLMFGVRYEYGITEKIRLGLHYTYYNSVESDVVGIHIVHSF
jgi:hypothetical protein